MRDMEEALLKYKRFSDGYDGNQRGPTPFHGENTGSIPVGRANKLSKLP
jgi:hypothetical protein